MTTLALGGVVVAPASCGGVTPVVTLADASASLEGGAPRDAASAEDARVSPPDAGSEAATAADAASGASCSSPSDCRAYSNHCDTCTCQALGAGSTDPVCPGTPVTCLVDPCQGKRADCELGRCVIR